MYKHYIHVFGLQTPEPVFAQQIVFDSTGPGAYKVDRDHPEHPDHAAW